MDKTFIIESPVPEIGPTHFLAVPEEGGESAIIKDARLKVGDRIVPTKMHRQVHSGGQRTLHIHSCYWVYEKEYPRWKARREEEKEARRAQKIQRKETFAAVAQERKNRRLGLVDAPPESEWRQQQWDRPLKKIFRSGKIEVVRVGEEVLRYANHERDGVRSGGTDNFCCLNCKEAVWRGQRAVLVFNSEGARRGAFCSPGCQTCYALEVIANRRLAKSKSVVPE